MDFQAVRIRKLLNRLEAKIVGDLWAENKGHKADVEKEKVTT